MRQMITSAFVGSVDLSDFVPRPSIHFARLHIVSLLLLLLPPNLLTTVAHQRKKRQHRLNCDLTNDYSSERRLYPYLAL